MTLERLWQLTNDAASNTAEFKEHYDFAGEVGPAPVLKLLIGRDNLRGVMERVARQTGPALAGILREALDADDAAWPKEKRRVDGGPVSL